jgi:hypothetical protein
MEARMIVARCALAGLALILGLALATPSAADSTAVDSTRIRAQSDAIYNATKKNAGTAVLLDFLLPSLGSAYAGEWGHGAPYLMGTVLGVAMLSGSEESLWGVGFALALTSRIGGMIAAGESVKISNKKLKANLGLAATPSGEPGIALTYRF